MNLAFGFFGVVFNALFSCLILWVNNLLEPRGERSFFNFLAFAENNLEVFALSRLQERRGYPDGHWMLQQYDPITFESIKSDRNKLKRIKSLPHFRTRRDKFHAHFDKDYAFDKKKIASDAPLNWSDLDEVVTVLGDILNRYSAAYDGVVYALKDMRIHDVDTVLDILYRYNQAELSHNLPSTGG
jgi:hypothetical protein